MSFLRKRAANNTSSDNELEDLLERIRHIEKKWRESRKYVFRECIFCDEMRSTFNFHVLDGCDHEPDVCGTCYAASLASQIDNQRLTICSYDQLRTAHVSA
jgi:hypothetical protein